MRATTIGVLMVAAAMAAGARAAPSDRPTFNRRTGLYEPPLGELRNAVARGDRAEIARAATRFGAARLKEALASAERETVLTALAAAVRLPGHVRLLDAVAPLLAAAEDEVTVQAAQTMGAMLGPGEPRTLEEWEVPSNVVVHACGQLLSMAESSARSTAQRLAMLDALAEAGRLCHSTARLALLARDPTPEIRRAVLLLLDRTSEPPLVLAAVDALTDGDPQVGAAAAVAVCRTGAIESPAHTDDTERLRRLAMAEETAAEDVAEMLPCLDPATIAAVKKARPALFIRHEQ